MWASTMDALPFDGRQNNFVERGRGRDSDMTQDRRIELNIVATYGRSLHALVIGLFCGRRALMVLGQMDCGLMV